MKMSIAIVVLALMTGACKQGRGERCQVDADCADGLSCGNADPKVCGGLEGNASVDAMPPVDAAPDARPEAGTTFTSP